MKYINYNAYTIINIEGKSFCPSTKKAFQIVVENAIRISVINSVGDFILFLAKISISVVTVMIALFVFKIPLYSNVSINVVVLFVRNIDFCFKFSIDEIKFQGAPLIIVCVISYLIANCFFRIYEVFTLC
jgi:solute carrier family 44 (choline transporter-like protein), member 1